MNRVLFICLGNICRSPMAEFIFKDIIRKNNLEEKFYVDSAATEAYNEIHKLGIYDEAKQVLNQNNIPFTEHISRQVRKEDYDKFDYILVMEQKNIRDISKIIKDDPKNKIHRLLDYTNNPKDIEDPWYYGNFDLTFKEIKYGCEEFLKIINKN